MVFGFGKKKADEVPAVAKPDGVVSSGERLNSNDLQYALDWAVNLGSAPDKDSDKASPLFEIPFRLKKILWDDGLAKTQNEQFQQFLRSDSYKRCSDAMLRSLDMDGDGKLTPKDFQIMYDKYLTSSITRNQHAIDKYLPFVGQCLFGVGVGFGVGALARRFYKSKYLIGGVGLLGYSGIQYLAQENFVNRSVLEEAFKAKVTQLADVNGDGEISREDVNMLVDNRLKFVATKLGPGGIAPGVTGYISLLLGFARGIRII